MEAANPEPYRVLARLALTTSTGAVQMWQQDQLQWTREEGLADIRAAELVELPEPKIASHADREQETFGARVARQLLDAQVRAYPSASVEIAFPRGPVLKSRLCLCRTSRGTLPTSSAGSSPGRTRP